MRRPLYGWLSAEAFSITGTRISMIAIPLFVLDQTGSATKTGLVAMAELVPLVLFKVLGGPVIDRLGPRRVAIACDVASMVVLASIPLLYDAGALPFAGLLALVAAAGALRGPGDGAKQAMVPALVDCAGVAMERATGLSSTVERTASMLGAALAGVLVVAFGAQHALLVNAATFAVSALLLAWATAPSTGIGAPPPVVDDDAPPYGLQLREGWDFLRRDPVLLAIAVMVALTNLFDAAWFSVLMPVWSVESGAGAGRLGLLFAVFSGASIAGALCVAAWAERLPRFKVYLVAFLLTGLPRFVVFVFDTPLVAVIAVFVVAGFAAGFINPVLGAVMFERIPAPLIGRVTSLTSAMCWSLMPLGGLIGGVLVDTGGLAFAMAAAGLAYFAATMLPAVDPRWRQIDDRPTRAVEQETAA